MHFPTLCLSHVNIFLSHWLYQIQQALDVIKFHRLFNLEFLQFFFIHTSIIFGVTILILVILHSWIYLPVFQILSLLSMMIHISHSDFAPSLLIFIKTKKGMCRALPSQTISTNGFQTLK